MRPPPRRVRLIDVAEAAGVSRSTASRALIGADRVSAETVRKVRGHADALGYVRDRRAAELASRTGGTVGLLVRGAHLSYYGEVAVAAQVAVERAGLELLVVNGLGGPDEHLRRVHTLRERGVDAAIIASGRIPMDVITPIASDLPVVACGRPDVGPDVGCVRESDTGVEELVRNAIAFGHHRVGVITASSEVSATLHHRSELMIHTLQSAGAHTFEVPLTPGTDKPSASALESTLPQVTLVMAVNDPCAIAVWEHCFERGIRIPDDISLTGYDGVGQLATPIIGLSTWRQPIEEMGARAARQVLRRIEDPSIPADTELVTGYLKPGRTLQPISTTEA